MYQIKTEFRRTIYDHSQIKKHLPSHLSKKFLPDTISLTTCVSYHTVFTCIFLILFENIAFILFSPTLPERASEIPFEFKICLSAKVGEEWRRLAWVAWRCPRTCASISTWWWLQIINHMCWFALISTVNQHKLSAAPINSKPSQNLCEWQGH